MKISVTITVLLYMLCLSDPILSAAIITSPLIPGQYIYYGDALDAHNLYMKAFGFGKRSRRSSGGNRTLPATGFPPNIEGCVVSPALGQAFSTTTQITQAVQLTSPSDTTSSGSGTGSTENLNGLPFCAQSGAFGVGTTTGGQGLLKGVFTSPDIAGGSAGTGLNILADTTATLATKVPGHVLVIQRDPSVINSATITVPNPAELTAGDGIHADRRKRLTRFNNASHMRSPGQIMQKGAGGPMRRRQ